MVKQSAPMGKAVAGQPIIIAPQRRAGVVAQVLTTSASGRLGFQSTPVDGLDLDFEGIIGNRHRGFLRKADARTPYLPRGTPIRNQRQISIVSVQDLTAIGLALGLKTRTPASALGANVVLDGIASLSFLPRGTKLLLPSGAILIIEDQNAPCSLAGEGLMLTVAATDGTPPDPEIKRRFPKVAVGLRGLVATVERPGRLSPGDAVTIDIPPQWQYHAG